MGRQLAYCKLALFLTAIWCALHVGASESTHEVLQLHTRPHIRHARDTADPRPGFQSFCWDALNVPPEALVQQAVSAEADAFRALRAALGELPLQRRRSCHKLALLVPYRSRPEQLAAFLPHMHAYLEEENVNFDIFMLEQSPHLRFNRGALLNAGLLLTSSLDYDYFVVNDIDTMPAMGSGVHYSFPEGDRPLHITPQGLHPKYYDVTDFFGGNVAFSWEQIASVNGYGTEFWGWGKEDENLRERLKQAGRWPPQKVQNHENLSKESFVHLQHKQHQEIRSRSGDNAEVFREAEPFQEELKEGDEIANMRFFHDFTTGLNTTTFCVTDVQRLDHLAVKVTLELHCERTVTPWCIESEDPAS